MKQSKFQLPALILLLILAACTSAGQEQTPPPTALTEEPASAPVEMDMPLPSTDGEPVPAVTEMVVAENLSTHTDETYAYSFDYPVEWMLDPIAFGARAPGGYQLTSWAHEPGLISEVPADGTLMNILVQLWDPKADLAAFVEQRKTAWEASGIQITSEADVTLASGAPAREFTVNGPDGVPGYFLFSVIGEDYLVASGNGDIELIRQVARSLR
jgi:hypothetical protein